ncbi:hypothetical protein SmJEL517_g05387 [Synchytrium microbalum]|uniref:Flavin-nucleotide-binding protein n=1 Tax=Synchytrium microbalum TaxID=1806994 RepID=A0A507C100_9FUNG|nr:uncharacterized protein SmJEL517_g05387 [Synchytrium microbalum]TPX31245.1 hypothetical protein SmJEL517_g05387 [Synchytrium microbalum]
MEFEKNKNLNQVRRLVNRAAYDYETVNQLLDSAILGHVGFAVDGQPFVIPMLYARHEESIYLHGYVSARIAKVLATGCPVTMSVAHVDGLVVSKSPFHNSVNYRQVSAFVVFGTGKLVDDEDEKLEALRIITEGLLKDNWGDGRLPSKTEIKSTSVIRVDIESASTKDIEDPENKHVWTGVVPIASVVGEPIPSEYNTAPSAPEYITRLVGGPGK